MMPSPLINLLLGSEIRTELLHLLQKGPASIEIINRELNTNSVTILPQLKKLKDYQLVIQEKKVYSLSPIGGVLVRKTEPMLKIFRLFEKDLSFWNNQILWDTLPPRLLSRLEALDGYIPIGMHGMEGSEQLFGDIKRAFYNSKKILILVSYFHPDFPLICAKHAKRGSELSLVLTPFVYASFSHESGAELDTLLSLENSDVWVLEKDIDLPTLVATDTLLLASIPEKGNSCKNRNMACFSEVAANWGGEVFLHYRSQARPLRQGTKPGNPRGKNS